MMRIAVVLILFSGIFVQISCFSLPVGFTTTNPLYSCKFLKKSEECVSLKIFIGLIFDVPMKNDTLGMFREEITRFLNDCQLWDFDKINITFVNEYYGEFFSCDNLEYCLKFMDQVWVLAHREFLFDKQNHYLSRNEDDSLMYKAFKEYFLYEEKQTLSLSYFLTDLTDSYWDKSPFVRSVVKKPEYYSKIFNQRPVYTKFIQYTNASIDRPTCCRFIELHKKSPYYFEELVLFKQQLGIKDLAGRTYSLCKELPKNYSEHCKAVGLSQSLKEYENEEKNCYAWHLTVFIMLDRNRTKTNDINKIQEILRNLMNDCSDQHKVRITFIVFGQPNPITCTSESECVQKIRNFMTLEQATSEWSNESAFISMMAKSLSNIKTSIQYGFNYEANTFYAITNFACEVKTNPGYIYTAKKFFNYYNVNYALALWTRQYRVLTKFLFIDQTNLTTCDEYFKEVIHVSHGYLKHYEADKNYEHLQNELRICLLEAEINETTLETIQNVEKFEEGPKIQVVFIAVPILTILIILIGVIFKKYCSPKPTPYVTRNRTSPSTIIDSWQIDISAIEIDHHESLGKGAYSTVFKGLLKNEGQIWSNIRKKSMILALGMKKSKSIDVAIKVFHRNEAAQTPSKLSHYDYMREVSLMKDFGYHPHVVNLIGWVEIGKMPCLVLEYCAKRDLFHYLQDMQDVIKASAPNIASGYENFIGLKDLYRISWEVSDAMVFLSSLKLIHRDIAARNVLLTENLVAKLSDFGLCQYLDKGTYPVRCSKLPIKYMALESLQKGEFSNKTDIWSFGVLLYEIFSIGAIPYRDIESHQLITFLKEENRLGQPEFCEDHLYDLMKSCWNSDPSQRPTFEEIRKNLSKLIGKDQSEDEFGYIQFLDIPEVVVP